MPCDPCCSAVPVSIPTRLDASGSNFLLWQARTQTILQARGLWALTNGSENPPLDSAVDDSWHSRDAAARLQIMHNLPDALLWIVYPSCATARAQWAALNAHFLPSSSYKAYFALKRFRGARMDDGADVAVHVQRMGALWQEVVLLGAYNSQEEKQTPDMAFALGLLGSLPESWCEFAKTWTEEVGRMRTPSATVIGRLLDMDFLRRARKGEENGSANGKRGRVRGVRMSAVASEGPPAVKRVDE